jgi:hemoglobin
MKTDIKNRADIEKLVNHFYLKVKKDQSIGYFFNKMEQSDWDKLMIKMTSFWENILFASGDYEGNPMLKHEELNKIELIDRDKFHQWNQIFEESVDELFEGNKAIEIKNRGLNISAAIIHKTLR